MHQARTNVLICLCNVEKSNLLELGDAILMTHCLLNKHSPTGQLVCSVLTVQRYVSLYTKANTSLGRTKVHAGDSFAGDYVINYI